MKTKSAMKKGKVEKIQEPEVVEEPRELKPEDLGPKPWVQDLADKEVNDGNWSCYLCLLVELVPQTPVLNQLVEAFSEEGDWPKRSNVRAISFLDVVKMVKTRCSKSKKVCPLSVLCDEIKEAAGVNFDRPIPGELLAPLVKYMILEWREMDDLWRADREASVVAEQERRRALYEESQESDQKSEDKGKADKKSEGKGKADKKSEGKGKADKKSEGKGKADKKSEGKDDKEEPPPQEPPPPPPRKLTTDTTLTSRYHHPKYHRTTEGGPEGGPDYYFLLFGCYDPSVPTQLLKFRLPLRCILKLSCGRRALPALNALAGISKYNFYMNRRKPLSALEEFAFWFYRVSKFWDRTKRIVNDARTYLDFKDVLIGKLVPPFHLLGPRNFQETVLKFRRRLYEDICSTFFNIYEIGLLYNQYLNEVSVIQLPTSYSDEDSRFYHGLLDAFSPDAVTLPFILDTIVAQKPAFGDTSLRVIRWENYSLAGGQIANWLGSEVCVLVGASYIGYSLDDYTVKKVEHSSVSILDDEDELDARLSNLHEEYDMFVEPKERDRPEGKLPDLAEERDELCLRTCHMGELGRLCRDRTEHVLKTFWEAQGSTPASRVLGDSSGLAELLASRLPGPEPARVARLLLQLNAVPERSLPSRHRPPRSKVSSSKSRGKRSTAEFNKDNRTLAVGERALRMVSELNFHEELTPSMMLPALFDSYTRYNTMTVTYSPHVGRTLVRFDEDVGVRNWEAELPTPVLLKEFFEQTMGEELEWLRSKTDSREPTTSAPWTVETLFKNAIHPTVIPVKLTDDCVITFEDYLPKSSPMYEKYQKAKKTINLATDPKPELEKLEREKEEIVSVKKDGLKIERYDIGPKRRTRFSGSERDIPLGRHCRLRLRFFRQLYESAYASVMCYIGQHCLRYSTPMEAVKTSAQVHLTHRTGIIVGISESVNSADNGNRMYYPNVSWPSGLFINMVRGGAKYIRQRYLNGVPASSGLLPELYRCILEDGNVIKFNENGEVKILMCNGTIVELYEMSARKGGNRDQLYGETEFEGESPVVGANYYVTTSDGRTVVVVGSREILIAEGDAEDNRDAAADTITTVRGDGTVLVHARDGMLSVDFSDGTRMVCKAEFTGEEVSCEFSEDEYRLIDEAINRRLEREAEEKNWNLEVDEVKVARPKSDAKKVSIAKSPRMSMKSMASREGGIRPSHFPTTNIELRHSSLGRVEPFRLRRQSEYSGRTVRTSEGTVSARSVWSGGEFRKISAIQDTGFVVISTNVLSVEHPYYAKINYDSDKVVFEMPFDVRLELSEWGVERIVFGTEATLDVRNKERTFAFQGSGLEFTIGVDGYEGFDAVELVPKQMLVRVADSEGNSVGVDTLGEVCFKGKIWPKDEEQTRSRFFAVGEDFSGVEFLPEDRVMGFFKQMENVEGTVLQKYDSGSFSEYVSLRPLEGEGRRWTVPKGKGLGRSGGLPSTYGHSFLFPYSKAAPEGPASVPEVIVMRHARMARYSRPEFKNFPDVFLKCQADSVGVSAEAVEPPGATVVEDLFRLRRERDPLLLEDFYLRGSLYEKSPDDNFSDEMKKVILRAAKLAVREEEKMRAEREFRFHRKAVVSGHLPPYFDTPQGLSLCLKHELLERVDRNIESLDRIKTMEKFLEIPFDKMTDEMFGQLLSLLESNPNKYSHFVKSRGNSLRMITEAGRNLAAYFPNVKSVLEYHMNHSCV
ncbi:hypothetical protein AAG570_010439 [Ranatra chinensis]|uniref:Sperm-associated antigen 17 n=1 Tax=Ranatra chinensis TaxID=642074 RepID=A0ABD0YPP3_9HEMI